MSGRSPSSSEKSTASRFAFGGAALPRGARYFRGIRRRHQAAVGLRLHRHWLRIRRQRQRAPAGREGLQGRGHGDGPPLDAGKPAAHQLVAPSLVLAAGPGAARLLQHALLPPRHHPARLRRGRRLDHLRLHAAAPSGQSLGQRVLGGPGRLEGRRCRSITTPPRACWASPRTRFSGPPIVC